MTREYRGHKYEIRKLGEGRYWFQVWLPGADTRVNPGHSFGSPRTEDEADQMAKTWIDDHGAVVASRLAGTDQ
jgi:hypothetical protein